MTISGTSILGAKSGQTGGVTFQARDRLNGDPLEPLFHESPKTEVDDALELAVEAFAGFGSSSWGERAALLERIAANLESLRDEIVTRAYHETGLPVIRLNGELSRTTGQFRFFATMLRKGMIADIRIDLAEPGREPTPKPEIRSMLRPIGPIAVFGAANFPLAFSVVGGDTASALAAGCPVIAKSHPSHPGTCELAGQAIREAVQACAMPDGVFSMLHLSHEGAGALIDHPDLAGAGFTGSRRGGLALLARANSRTRPIPFFAEMSSVNPVVILPGALGPRTASLAKALTGSLTLGVGQFCTNPGLIFVVGESEALLSALRFEMEHSAPGLMLNAAIEESYIEGCRRLAGIAGVSTLVRPSDAGAAGLFATDLATFASTPALQDEVFGPSALVVRCRDIQEAMAGLAGLEGQLTASLHLAEEEAEAARHLFAKLERLAGRIIVNGFPTGVEVCDAMVHGGPFPATSDGRSTSVGGRAPLRWMRPVAYQDVFEALLPPELRPPAYS